MTTPAILSVRVSAQERALLQSAAAAARTNVSDFVRRKAVEAAELDMLDRHDVVIPVEDWEAFEAWLATPSLENPKLRRLADSKPLWED
jgi:uncharacterized protein (DUF1778 family)